MWKKFKAYFFPHVLGSLPHIFEETAWNCYYVPVERTCKFCGCKEYLLTFDEIHNQLWEQAHKGPHPIAEELRQKRITKNF